jgi:hypothetical protein
MRSARKPFRESYYTLEACFRILFDGSLEMRIFSLGVTMRILKNVELRLGRTGTVDDATLLAKEPLDKLHLPVLFEFVVSNSENACATPISSLTRLTAYYRR